MGRDVLDRGFIYRPYIPLQITPTVNLGSPEPPLPSAIDKLAAVGDPEIAKRNQEMIAAHKKWVDEGGDGFNIRKGIRSRHATKLIRPEFFSVAKVSNL
jgi:hypothetical protein